MNSLEAYITCPFNKSHRIVAARFQYHLAKCRKNYPKDMKVVCIFDATHMLDAHEIEHHLSICPSSGNIKCYENSFETERQLGTISLDEACNLESKTITEDWSGSCTSYNPILESENKNVLRMKIGLSKAKKKQFKQNERDRISTLEKENSNNSNVGITEKIIDFDTPLRTPKNVSKAVSYIENNSTDTVTSALNNISMNEASNPLEKRNISTLNSNSPKKVSSQKSSSRDRTINMSNASLTSKDTSDQEEEKNVCFKENIPIAINCSIPTAGIKDSKVKDEFESIACEGGSPKMQGHCKESKIQKDRDQSNLKKGCSIKTRSGVPLNLQMTEKLYGAVKKISTGRGFTMAHQLLSSSLVQSENEDPKKLDSLSDYDDE
ncbi:uncharacterized protein LOC143427682 [Xylocopa sonorina]|uniref:uncharacterized protein LOC143427682 n=1 Tax=Xylocopa sonorina TaxID=1818115 RepID=UPI00403B3765